MPDLRLRAAALLLSACGQALAQGAAAGPAADELPAPRLRLEPRLSELLATDDQGRPSYASADVIRGRVDHDLTLRGEAEVRRAGTVIRAERIRMLAADDELVAVGNVRVVRQGSVFSGPALQLRMEDSTGIFLSPSFALGLLGGRGRAERLEFLGEGRVAMQDAVYTGCRADDPDWFVRAQRLEIDQQREEGSGRSAGLFFRGRQVLAAPVFGFPLGEGRRSGFLPPSFSYTTRSGAELLAPYYFDIAPNRDLTLYPRFMTLRGLQLGGQLRYLEPRASGDLRAEFTPRDTATGESRLYWSGLHNYANVGGWSGQVNARGVSDDNYFVDYSRSILASSDRVLPRDAFATRNWRDWTVLLRATRYQSILDARAAPPYERLPQLSLSRIDRDIGGFEFEQLFDATRFRRPLADSVEGNRLVAYPRVAYPLIRPGWFITPRVGVHLSSYRLDQTGADPVSLNRSVPIGSLEAGLVFERPTRLFGRELTQTLEPRLFYVRSPYRDQSAFPVFDTGVADFNFAQLFSDNTFVGNDRIADQNQLTTALVSRMVDPGSGVEAVRLAFGQRTYFSEQRVAIPGVAPRTDPHSDLLLAGSAVLGGGMSLDAGLQYSVRDSSVPRVNLLWRYLPADGRIFNAGVRYLRDELGQVDTSWRWPVSAGWMALGRVNYSWLRRRTDPSTLTVIDAQPGIIEAIAGFERNADCWTLRFVLQRFVTAAGVSTSTFFIQLELAGLARIGSDPFDILRRNIPGYRLPADRPSLPSRYFGYE
ncbi:MAG: LPS-assembly protein LptD [Betaproteobacteria bacterium]|nr:LPS-assembly protein LptD [Betaproteobacteria bacterium]